MSQFIQKPGSGGGTLAGDVTGPSGSNTVAKLQGVAISGAPSAGQVLTASGAAAATWSAASGGSPGLPVWTFQASDGSDPDVGKFTTDNASPDATALIKFNAASVHGGNLGPALADLPPNVATLVLVSPTGVPQPYEVVTSGAGGSINTITVGGLGATPDLWSGDYQLSVWPYNFAALPQILAQANVTPIANGTYFGITFESGIAVSAATPQADGIVTPVTSGTIGSGGALLNLS